MKDTFGLVPPEIQRMLEAEDFRDRQVKAGRAISEALTALHPGLDLVFVRHDATPGVVPPGAVPGRWHVRNKEAQPIPTFTPITAPDGGYREPDSGILQELADRDMRRPEVAREIYERPQREKEKRQKAKALEGEQHCYDMAEDLRAGWRVKGRILRDDGTPVKRKRVAR
jgi:hypothetical protein